MKDTNFFGARTRYRKQTGNIAVPSTCAKKAYSIQTSISKMVWIRIRFMFIEHSALVQPHRAAQQELTDLVYAFGVAYTKSAALV